VVGRNATDTKMWTVDALYEKKFGNLVPNLQVGYIDQKDTRGNNGEKASLLYIQGGVLFDQMMGFGKPALAIRLEQNQNKSIAGAGANMMTPKLPGLAFGDTTTSRVKRQRYPWSGLCKPQL
jgi:hypothetical protein